MQVGARGAGPAHLVAHKVPAQRSRWNRVGDRSRRGARFAPGLRQVLEFALESRQPVADIDDLKHSEARQCSHDNCKEMTAVTREARPGQCSECGQYDANRRMQPLTHCSPPEHCNARAEPDWLRAQSQAVRSQ